MAKPAKLAHVVYSTRRFDQMIDWYQKVFEAKVVHRDPMLAFLTFDDEHHRFAFANLEMLKPDGNPDERLSAVGVNHVGYTFSSIGELLENYDRLKQLGINSYWKIHHGITLSAYYNDPDGNRMEFQVDCCKSADEAATYMLSDAFTANPIGVEVDMDSLLAQYRSGVPAEQLLAIPAGPMSPIPAEHGL